MMADPESKRDNSVSTQIILAIISLLGVVAVAHLKLEQNLPLSASE